MALINPTWYSEIKYSQPCIGFPKYYWLNYEPVVYSKQYILLSCMNELSLLVGIPQMHSYNCLRSTQPPESTQQLLSLTPALRGETKQTL